MRGKRRGREVRSERGEYEGDAKRGEGRVSGWRGEVSGEGEREI